jgi:hypothetical protein
MDRYHPNEDENPLTTREHGPDCFCQLCRPLLIEEAPADKQPVLPPEELALA